MAFIQTITMNSSTKIEKCSNCNSQYRIPTDKSIIATCPNCKQKFHYKLGSRITDQKSTINTYTSGSPNLNGNIKPYPIKEKQINIGNEIPTDSTGIYKVAYYTKSVLHYLSGIEKFDKILDGRKYSETKYQLIIKNFSTFLSFQIFLEEKTPAIFNLYKADVKDIILRRDQKIEIDTLGEKEDKLGALAGLGGIIGGVAAIATDSLSNVMKKDKLFVKSKEHLKGNIYEIIINKEQDKIMLTALDGQCLDNVNAFFSKALNFNFSGKYEPKKIENKNCYVATLCYGDIDAIQVATFRNYRDNVLNKTITGRTLVKLYYKVSPIIVRRLNKRKKINLFIRYYILDRIYNKIK